jgi:hypothetical protein
MERLRASHAHVPRRFRRLAARDAARQLTRKTRAGQVDDPLAGVAAGTANDCASATVPGKLTVAHVDFGDEPPVTVPYAFTPDPPAQPAGGHRPADDHGPLAPHSDAR